MHRLGAFDSRPTSTNSRSACRKTASTWSVRQESSLASSSLGFRSSRLLSKATSTRRNFSLLVVVAIRQELPISQYRKVRAEVEALPPQRAKAEAKAEAGPPTVLRPRRPTPLAIVQSKCQITRNATCAHDRQHRPTTVTDLAPSSPVSTRPGLRTHKQSAIVSSFRRSTVS